MMLKTFVVLYKLTGNEKRWLEGWKEIILQVPAQNNAVKKLFGPDEPHCSTSGRVGSNPPEIEPVVANYTTNPAIPHSQI